MMFPMLTLSLRRTLFVLNLHGTPPVLSCVVAEILLIAQAKRQLGADSSEISVEASTILAGSQSN